MTEYAFDIKLSCSIRVKAATLEEAKSELRGTLDCASANLGQWRDHSPIDCEVSMEGEPQLYEIDGMTHDGVDDSDPRTEKEIEISELETACELALSALENQQAADDGYTVHGDIMKRLRSAIRSVKSRTNTRITA